MKHQDLWAFFLIIFSVINCSSSASIDITTMIPLEYEEDTTEVIISADYNNDLAEELLDIDQGNCLDFAYLGFR